MAEAGAKSRFGRRHATHRTTPTKFGGMSISAPISQTSKKMNHRFTFILSGVSEITAELADAIYGATGGDIEFNMRDGVAFLEFDRTAASLHDAITSTISQVEGAGVGVRVVRVESDDANTIAKINADLLGVTSGS